MQVASPPREPKYGGSRYDWSMRRVDLSADLGELPGPEGRRHDVALMGFVTTAHLACGGHAGDVESMAAGIEAALARAVQIGAHPSYLDREGFGRRPQSTEASEVVTSVLEQLSRLDDLAAKAGARVASVKPHGALYHDLSTDPDLAELLFAELSSREGVVVLAAASRAVDWARAAGCSVIEEGFCDRRYRHDGGLVARTEPDAMVDEPSAAAAQAVLLVSEGLGASGQRVDSICLHSDHRRALEIAQATREALSAAGIDVTAP